MAYRHDGFWQCMDTLREQQAARAAVGLGPGAVEGVGVRVLSPATTATSAACSCRCCGAPATTWSGSTPGCTRAARSAREPEPIPVAGRDIRDVEAERSRRHRRGRAPGRDLERPARRPQPGHHATTSTTPAPSSSRVLRGRRASNASSSRRRAPTTARPARSCSTSRRPSTRSPRTGTRRCWPSATSPSWRTTASARSSCAAAPPTASRRGSAATSSSTTSPATRSRPGRCCSEATARRGGRSCTSRTWRARSSPRSSADRDAVHGEAFNVGSTGENYRVRQVGELVERLVPGSRIVFGEGAGPDVRTYRVELREARRDAARRASRGTRSPAGSSSCRQATSSTA